jgi:tol-pal system protein YbgF
MDGAVRNTGIATLLARLYPVKRTSLTWRWRSRSATAVAGALLLFGASALSASAQQTDVPTQQAPAPEAAAPAGDRVARLEQQVANLQAMVAALESLVKAQPSAVLPQESVASGGQGFDAAAGVTARVDALETQIGALSSQLESLTQQLGAIEARLGGSATPQPLAPPAQQQQYDQQQYDQQPEPLPELPGRQGSAPTDPAGTLIADAGGLAGFGSTQQATPPMSPPAAPGEPQRLAAVPDGVDAASLYSQGYGQLLQRDYAGAEASFRTLVERFPADSLAGKAEYWLGESYYARGVFKDAADAFLESYRTYGSGEKAPDSLLKLGMSLAELGEEDAACSTFAEFGAKYPSAEPALLDQAKAERRKVGC